MNKGCLVVLVVSLLLFCSMIAFVVGVRKVCRDRTILEHVIDNTYALRIRTVGCWVGHIYVYLEIDSKDGRHFRSETFTAYIPEQVESRTLGLEIRNVENIIFLYRTEEPDNILVMVSFEDNLIYPQRWRRYYYEDDEKKLYYTRVRKRFLQLRTLLGNEDLSLDRFIPPAKYDEYVP